MTTESDLKHYGVKGMKWGIRKDRQDKSGMRSVSDMMDRKKPGVKESTVANKPRSAPKISDSRAEPKRVNDFRARRENRRMSDAELRSRLARLQMEKQYRELTAKPKSKSFVAEVLADSGKQAMRQLATRSVNAGLQLALEAAAKNSKGGAKVVLTAIAEQGKKKKDK